MFTGSQDAKEQIRQAVDIVDVIGEQIELRRRGREFVGLCPWHDDSRPSFTVNPGRQSWRCWVCNLGGDVFSYVMQREGIEFREALEMLAERAGITLQPQSPQRQIEPGSPEDKNTLYRAMAWAAEQYHQCLVSDAEGEPGRRYLAERQINADSIEAFQLGFVPNAWQWLLERAAKTPFTSEVLQAVGLTLKSDRTGRWFDRFRGRLMFPIFDTQRRAIAVGGRILPQFADEKAAKYINSPETRLFSKSEQLYGLHLARDVVSRSREVIVMEGYTDVVVARQYGVDNAVAVLGTALGPRHINILRRFADRITLLLDGDAAGQRRAQEILELFIANQIDLRIVTLPGEMDPCDYLLQHGFEALKRAVSEAPDVWEYKIQVETRGFDPVRDTHQANQALENLLMTLAKAARGQQQDLSAQRLREHQILNRLTRLFRVEEEPLRRRLGELRQKPLPDRRRTTEEPSPSRVTKLTLEPMERDLFELLLKFPESVASVLEQIHVTQLKTAAARELYQLFAELVDQSREPTFEQLVLETDDVSVKSLLVSLDEASQKKQVSEPEVAVDELIRTFHRRVTEEQLQRQQASLDDQALSEEQKLGILFDLLKKRQELIDQ